MSHGIESRPVRMSIIMAFLSFILSAFVAYSYETDTTHQRISVVETQQKNDGTRLERIEHTTERVEDKVDRLLAYPTPANTR